MADEKDKDRWNTVFGCGCLGLMALSLLGGLIVGIVTLIAPDYFDSVDPATTSHERRSQTAASQCAPFGGQFVRLTTQGNPDRVICKRVDQTFVALAFGDRDQRWWRTVRRGGKWVNLEVARIGRVADRAPLPPVPYTPLSTFTPDAPPVDSDLDPGYTGPRCYAPGGKTYTPC